MESVLLEMALNAGLSDHQTTRQFSFTVAEGTKAILIDLSF